MVTSRSGLVRWWRLSPWNRNPLMRPAHRLLAAVRIIAVLVWLAAIPVACAIGTAAYSDAAVDIQRAAARDVTVTATIDSIPISTANQQPQANVHWILNGHTATALVDVAPHSAVGDHLTVWLDRAGGASSHKPHRLSPIGAALGAATITLLAVGIVEAAAVWTAGKLVSRRIGTDYDREWQHLDRPTG